MRNELWRSSPARWRRIPPVGFVPPCEPTLDDRPPAGPGWLHEVKHDGFRMVQVWSRDGVDFTSRFSRIAEAVRDLPVAEALVDGEAVVFRDYGRSDYYALMTKRGGTQASFVAFDLLRLNNDGLRLRPIEARREALMRLVAGVNGILLGEALVAEGAVVFAKACELSLEGIVSKRAGSFYRSGKSRNWLKTKNPNFVRT
jgi:ATP-dependent DNA ligase